MAKWNSYIFLKYGLLILVAVLLASCTAERKLATDFYRKRHQTAILLIPADFVYKRNLKAFEIENADQMDDATLDSVLFAHSTFMQHISDSVFLETYMNSLIGNLRNQGLKVYLQPDTDLFFDDVGEKYIVNVAQLMLEEYVELLFDPDYDVEYSYLGDFYLNKVSLSSWFEISGVNEQAPETVLAFAEMTMNDQFDGRLRYYPFTGNVAYTYSVDSIRISDIYSMARAAGSSYSSYLFDYMLNRYIDRNIPPTEPRRTYYRYDFNLRMLRQAEDERFILLERE
jgi:hypothetical protein